MSVAKALHRARISCALVVRLEAWLDATARSLLPLVKRYVSASRPVDAEFISEYIVLQCHCTGTHKPITTPVTPRVSGWQRSTAPATALGGGATVGGSGTGPVLACETSVIDP